MTIILTWIFVNLLYFSLKNHKVQRKFIFGRKVRNLTLYSYSIMVGRSVSVLPGRNFARTMFIFYSFLFIIIRNGYIGAFYELSQKTVPKIQSISELIERNFTLVALISYKENFEDLQIFENAR